MSRRSGEERVEQADIVVSAEVEADEVEVRVVPDHAVRVYGEEEAGSVRDNLPERVTEGEQYRAVHIRYALAIRFLR
ncbi:hypothetical protein [Herbidospora sp. RD11066]